ncbi:MAG TPA: sigma-70 family RNA polymerase sigma factor [Ktedonobacterales bacterium]|nr:sigma-70 family RNA polymerase sigma factor [Ktedonobacterales bacterium]
MVAQEPCGPSERAGASPSLAASPINALYEEHLTAIYRFIFSKVGNREEAEDLTSQVFMKAVRHLDQSRHIESIQSWLFQVARTTVADHWRRFYRIRLNSLDDLLESGWEGPREERPGPRSMLPEARVQRLLALLPDRYREVLTLRFLENCSIAETAQQMGLSEPNVKVLQFRALKKAATLERSD